ncbi:MAG TPA: hypothetical protein VJ570_06285 [Holophagaceae bacterium]|nr:hypothetical protein [Holophagaceae bacterium]
MAHHPSESPLEDYLALAARQVPHPRDRERFIRLVTRWASQWTGKSRKLEVTASHHGTFLHFNQLIGTHWMQAFTFEATKRHGVFLKGPDPDRGRKSHKLRSNPLDPSTLDALFDAWSAHPEGRPAGKAMEFFLEETPDETWEACLQEALACLKG